MEKINVFAALQNIYINIQCICCPYWLLYLNLKLSSAKPSHLTGFWDNNVCLGAEGMWGWASYTV
jgi:hypothetical protein